MVKKRTGDHERAIRELLLKPGRVSVGEEIREFHGILGGELRYEGGKQPLLEAEGESS